MAPAPLFTLLGFPVTWYLLLFAAGVGLAPVIILPLARRRRVPQMAALDLWFAAAAVCLAGILGPALLARLVLGSPGGPWGMTGIGAAVLAVAVLPRLHPTTRGAPHAAVDVLTPALALSEASARLGCFAAGCCHGRPAWGVPWAVTFPSGSACLYQGIPVHPTQLYEAAGCLALAALLAWLAWRGRLTGALPWVFVGGYGCLRFVVEAFRGTAQLVIGPLTWAQAVCLVVVAVAGAALLLRRRTVARGWPTPA